jgi:hypothetical protein
MTEIYSLLLRRLFDEVINGHNYVVIDQLFAPDYVNHGPFPANTPDLASLKRFFAANPEAFPTCASSCRTSSRRDLVAYRAVVTGTHRGEFAGMKPTGRRITARRRSAALVHRPKILGAGVTPANRCHPSMP